MIWTSFENFEAETLKDAHQCMGCDLWMSIGSTCMKLEKALKPGRKTKTIVRVHNQECWASWEQAYWSEKAKHRDALVKKGKGRDARIAKAGLPVKGGVFSRWQ